MKNAQRQIFYFNQPLFVLTLGIAVGIFIQSSLEISELSLVVGLVASLPFWAGIFLWFKKGIKIATFCFAIWVGAFLQMTSNQRLNPEHYTRILQIGTLYALQGEVQSIKGKNAVIQLQMQRETPVSGKISLRFKDSLPRNFLGKRLLFYTRLLPIEPPKNPFEFDYQQYMKRRNVFWQGNALEFQLVGEGGFSLEIVAQKFRSRLISALAKYHFSEQSRAVMGALLLGYRDEIQPDIYQNYADAGAIHLLAISGLHIGILVGGWMLLLNIFFPRNRYKWIKITLILSFLWCYALLTGLSPSVVRATTMFSFLSITQGQRLRKGRYDALVLSAFVLLIFNPNWLFEVGFQLSYAAVFSIVTFFPVFQPFAPKNKVLKIPYDIFCVSLAAQLGVMPLSLYYFHQFPGLFFVTNLQILPFLGVILGAGIFILILAYFDILPEFVAVFYDKIIGLMNAIVAKIAGVEAFIFRDVFFTPALLVISVCGVVALGLWVLFGKKKYVFAFLLAVLGVECCVLYDAYREGNRQNIIVYSDYHQLVMSVQQGAFWEIFSEENSAQSLQKYVRGIKRNFQPQQIVFKELPPMLQTPKETFLIVSEPYYLPEVLPAPIYLILTNSPPIHLGKFLQNCPNVKMVIASGHNKKWVVAQWEKTCQQKKIPFHWVSEKESLKINLY